MLIKRSLLRQARTIFPAVLYSFICGTHYAWTFANVDSFRSAKFNLDDEEISLVACAMHIGRILPPILVLFLPINFGRKTYMIASGLLLCAGSTVLLYQKALYFLLGARLLIGFGMGIGDISQMMYSGEVLSKNIRGVYNSISLLLYTTGLMIQLVLCIFLPYDQILVILLALSLFLQLTIFDMVESPYYLCMCGSTTRALETIKWLHDLSPKEAEEQLGEISNQTKYIYNFLDLLQHFKKPEVYKSVCITASFGMISSIIGNILGNSTNLVLPASAELTSIEFAVCFNALLLVAVTICTGVIDRVGRRTLLIPSFVIQAVLNAIIALLFQLQANGMLNVPQFPWVIFIIITIGYNLFYLGCQIPISTIRTEIFASSFKNLGVSQNIIVNSATNSLSSYLFLHLIDNFGIYINFILFSVVSLLGAVVAYFLLPETKGKTLSEIQDALKNEKKECVLPDEL